MSATACIKCNMAVPPGAQQCAHCGSPVPTGAAERERLEQEQLFRELFADKRHDEERAELKAQARVRTTLKPAPPAAAVPPMPATARAPQTVAQSKNAPPVPVKHESIGVQAFKEILTPGTLLPGWGGIAIVVWVAGFRTADLKTAWIPIAAISAAAAAVVLAFDYYRHVIKGRA